jgi:signal transduction histidine kinase
MKKYAIPACYAKKIDLIFSSDSIQGQLMIPGNVRKNLFLVFKEAVNNVIKYSEASACSVDMDISNHRFILQIADNGVGMINKGKEQGYGMQNMRKRAEELKGNLEVSSIPGKGVTVRMMIPFPFKIPYTWDERGKEYD